MIEDMWPISWDIEVRYKFNKLPTPYNLQPDLQIVVINEKFPYDNRFFIQEKNIRLEY